MQFTLLQISQENGVNKYLLETENKNLIFLENDGNKIDMFYSTLHKLPNLNANELQSAYMIMNGENVIYKNPLVGEFARNLSSMQEDKQPLALPDNDIAIINSVLLSATQNDITKPIFIELNEEKSVEMIKEFDEVQIVTKVSQLSNVKLNILREQHVQNIEKDKSLKP